ncbi:hypothetical protein KJ877_00330 [bacterium]|nr:hypothetical protein [bacterium]MBU1990207.1 hypothetical protein [bacterium]
MEIFNKYKLVIFRSVGALMLLVGFGAHFWVTPKEGYTQAQIAAANVARMEASVAGESSASKKAAKSKDSPFLEEFKNTKEKQMRYLTIIAMILGIGFLGYSFIKKE